MKKPFTHFDLPKQHLVGKHYVPARARQSDEIERRHSLPSGTILLEQQRDGLAIIRRVMEQVEEEPDLTYIQNVLAACALNSSWYTYARDADEMRKRLVQAKLFDPETGEPRPFADMRAQAETQLDIAVDLASTVVDAHVENHLTVRQATMSGRAMGTAALYVATLPLETASYSMNPYEASLDQRERGLATLARARVFVNEIGSNATAAQISDPNSDVSVFVRRTAPDNVFNAFEEAVEEIRNAA